MAWRGDSAGHARAARKGARHSDVLAGKAFEKLSDIYPSKMEKLSKMSGGALQRAARNIKRGRGSAQTYSKFRGVSYKDLGLHGRIG